ncbi:MAG: SPASM domain-containing protein, partial [Myxococcota bacterium]|jgi:radical SAM protein with 4Fe4S-binding SPASM domain
MGFFGAMGCDAGNELCAIDAKGGVHGCSFCSDVECRAEDLEKRWPMQEAFGSFRIWEHAARQGSPDHPCLDCRYLEICRGGCHVVARHATGSWYAPDPSCTIAAAKKGFTPPCR